MHCLLVRKFIYCDNSKKIKFTHQKKKKAYRTTHQKDDTNVRTDIAKFYVMPASFYRISNALRQGVITTPKFKIVYTYSILDFPPIAPPTPQDILDALIIRQPWENS